MNCWLIVSWEHNAFWKPGRLGYTKVISEAGRYSCTQAKQIVEQANIAQPHDDPHEVMVVAPEFLERKSNDPS